MLPDVGLFRQSCCPKITMTAYRKARKEMNRECAPFMLGKITRNIRVYKLIRRNQSQALHKLFNKCLFRNYLVNYTMAFIPYPKPDSLMPLPPPCFHVRDLNYDTLNIFTRFRQMTGRLVSLGYPERDIPVIENLDLDVYLEASSQDPMIEALYHELVRKEVPDRWRILLSRIPEEYYNRRVWVYLANTKKMDLYISLVKDAFSQEEQTLLFEWTSRMKYPLSKIERTSYYG